MKFFKEFLTLLNIISFSFALQKEENKNFREEDKEVILRIRSISLKHGNSSCLIGDKENLSLSMRDLSSNRYRDGLYLKISHNFTENNDCQILQRFIRYHQDNLLYILYKDFDDKSLSYVPKGDNIFLKANLTDESLLYHQTKLELKFNSREINQVMNNAVSSIFQIIKKRTGDLRRYSNSIELVIKTSDKIMDSIELLEDNLKVLASINPTKSSIIRNLKRALYTPNSKGKINRDQVDQFVKDLH